MLGQLLSLLIHRVSLLYIPFIHRRCRSSRDQNHIFQWTLSWYGWTREFCKTIRGLDWTSLLRCLLCKNSWSNGSTSWFILSLLRLWSKLQESIPYLLASIFTIYFDLKVISTTPWRSFFCLLLNTVTMKIDRDAKNGVFFSHQTSFQREVTGTPCPGGFENNCYFDFSIITSWWFFEPTHLKKYAP